MQAAQHLVDRGVARYTAGSWSFPRDLEARDLPADMTQARRAKIETLGEAARTVAQAFALDRIGRFSLGECVVLGGEEDVA